MPSGAINVKLDFIISLKYVQADTYFSFRVLTFELSQQRRANIMRMQRRFGQLNATQWDRNSANCWRSP